ncbi:N-6 DNA methylase [bacterium]|nr:N-6 DNA methylase [bacterium]
MKAVNGLTQFEQEILKKYLISKKLDYKCFLSKFYSQIYDPPLLFESPDENLTIWKIIEKFETTIDENFKKLNGAFYTPYFIVDYINTRVILENSNEDIKVIDPACGSGVFLVDALFKLKQKLQKSYKELVEEHIFGIDIDPRAVKRTKILLSLIVFEHEKKIPEKFNIYNGNSLDKDFLRKTLNGFKFQAIVGNPPYVRIQNLDEETKKIIRKYWKFVQGDTDIFIPFIELGIELMNEKGKMGYITPNSYFTTHAGKNLRKFLQVNKYIEEIVDFDHYQVFEGITTYTAITIISKKTKSYFVLKKIRDNGGVKNLNKIEGEKIYFNELNPEKWVLVSNKEKEIITIIENSYYRLKDIADIRVGLATLADEVYILENPEEEGKYFVKYFNRNKFLIEKEITKEIIKVSIVKSEEDILKNKRRIIFPYKKINDRYVIISEEELKEKFPETYKYLLYCKDILTKRDKGKKEYETWYAYGRTQGINTSFGKKILTPPMALNPTFVVCEKEDATFYSGYAIFPKIKPFTDLYLLKKILNSEIMKTYIEATAKSYQGGWKSYTKTFIKNFGLPKLSDKQVEILRKEEDQKTINSFLKTIYYEQTKSLHRLL